MHTTVNGARLRARAKWLAKDMKTDADMTALGRQLLQRGEELEAAGAGLEGGPEPVC